MADEQREQGDERDQEGSNNEPANEERLIPEEEVAEDGQVYVDRDKIDFDPEEGLYSGTAVHGGTDIPGPHEQVDDIDPNESDDDSSDGEADGEADGETEDETDDRRD